MQSLGSDIRVIDSVIRYKAIPFTGTLSIITDIHIIRTLNRKSSSDDNHIFSSVRLLRFKRWFIQEFYTTGKPKFEGFI